MIDDLSLHDGRRTTSKEDLARPRRATPRTPLARRARDLVRIIKSLDAESGAGAVHDLRTTIRRVEALIAAEPEPSGGERKIQKQLDRIRKRAGKVRDVDVHLKALRGLPRTLAVAGRDELVADLRKSRSKRQKRLLRVVGDARDRGIVKRLRRTAALATDAVHADGAAVELALAAVLADFAALYERAQPLAAGNLHQFRIASKHLRYRAESFAPHPRAETIVAELKRAQDAIGTWHDWVTLAERAEKKLGADHAALTSAFAARIDSSLAHAIAVTTRVAGRLARLGPSPSAAARKGVRKVTAAAPPEVLRLAARTRA